MEDCVLAESNDFLFPGILLMRGFIAFTCHILYINGGSQMRQTFMVKTEFIAVIG